ncbi:MAG: response regulator [Gammaproteobacteria bacterium]|nr:response regulator [Gammaproteobacteria bacterium]
MISNQEQAFKYFYKQFPDGALHISAEGIILGLNNKAEQLLGWHEEEIIGQLIHEELCPDDSESGHQESRCAFGKDSLSKFINSPQDSLPNKFDQLWVKKNGVYLHLETQLFITYYKPKEPICFITFKDISNLRFSPDETQRLSLFPELNPSPVLQLDEQAVIHYANASMTDMMVKYGFSDNGFPNILPDNLSSITQKCYDRENFINIEKKFGNRYFSWNFHSIKEDHKRLIQVYGLDITERKLYESSLKELVKLHEVHSQQKSDFLSNMSHELRSPMSGILGMVNLLLDTDLSDSQFDYLDKIQKSSDTMLILINDILDLSKIEAGKLEINLEKFDLIDAMYDIVNLLEFQANQKSINLELRISPAIPNTLIGDSLRIRQIIHNFLTNAIKFTPSHGYVCLDVEFDKQILNNEVNLTFVVDDSGIGIDEENQQYVFGKYQQAESSIVKNYGGTGLGLAISKELAELMSAEIGLTSIKGEGSSFWLKITLPIDIHEEIIDAYYNKETNFFKKSTALEKKNCLIIGGLTTTATILNEQLKYWDAETYTIEEPETALQYLQSNNIPDYDFVFLLDIDDQDLIYQISNASEKLSINCDQYTNTRWISITQYPEKKFIAYLQELGFDALVKKPIHPMKFKNLLLECLKHIPGSQREEIKSIARIEKHLNVNKLNEEQFEFNILLAEDNLVNQKISKILLEKLGCKVSLAINGAEAVKQYLDANNNPFDAIFMDCHMPILDGFEASQEIRMLEKTHKLNEISIVALTANTAEDEMKNTQAAGMNAFLSKPIDKDKLISILSEIRKRKSFT